MASPSRSRSLSPRARRAAAAGPLARARARPLPAPPRHPLAGRRPPPLPRPRPRRGGGEGRRPGPEGALEGDGRGAPPGPQQEAPRARLTWGGFRARRGWGWRGGAGVAVADSAQPLLDPGQGAGGRLVWRVPALRRFAIALLRGAERAEPPRPPAQAPTPRDPGPRPRSGYEACGRSAAAHPSSLRPSRIQRPSQPGTAFHVGGHRSREKAAVTPRVTAPVRVPHSGRAVAAPHLTPGGQGPQWPPPNSNCASLGHDRKSFGAQFCIPPHRFSETAPETSCGSDTSVWVQKLGKCGYTYKEKHGPRLNRDAKTPKSILF